MKPLDHIFTKFDSTTEKWWPRFGRIISENELAPLLHELAWLFRKSRIYYLADRISGVDNHKSNDVS